MNNNGISKLIKNTNYSLVLGLIRNEQPISRAAISKKLGLSRSTVSAIIDELLQKKIVKELGLGNSTKEGGRRGIELGFNAKSAYGLGVDIGGTKILVVITDWDGEIVYKEKVNTSTNVDEIISIVKSCIKKSGIEENLIIAMGVGVPGITNSELGVVIDAPSLGWQNLRLMEMLQTDFSFPVFVNNDVNCAALGEGWLGSGDNSKDMVFVAFGTGVGCALISKGALVEGHNYSSGEIGYFIDIEDVQHGLTNSIGEFGTFENKTSGLALSKHGYTAPELFKLYQNNSPEAVTVIRNFVMHVSIALANISSLLNPEKIVIGGGVSESMPVVIEQIKENVSKFTPFHSKIELAELGTDAGGLGAIAYAFQKLQQAN